MYDTAGVLDPATIAYTEGKIDAIEGRTGAEVVVYTQVVPDGVTAEEAESHALALLNQWGVGRAGFDDGLVILLDLEASDTCHGQAQLYGAEGYRAAYLSNAERQQIFEHEMLPLLRGCDLDSAIRVAIDRVDAAATPAHAAELQRARQIDAAIGLVGAPIVGFGLVLWGLWSWRQFGRDPVYLDDPSIHLPAPPPDLTAASAALVRDGRTSRRALTTALLDLASRGRLAFREEKHLLGLQRKVGIEIDPPAGDPTTEAQRARNARRPIADPEEFVLEKVRGLGKGGGYVEPEELPAFGSQVSTFNDKLERHVVSRGWLRERPSRAVARWLVRGIVAIVAGVIAVIVGVNLPSAGVVMIGAAGAVGGLVLLLIAPSMPAVTIPGAMVRAMLAAYRRTLLKTMAEARSMQQVVFEARLGWLETPDQAIVWGLALGLQDEIEEVMERTFNDIRAGLAPSSTYVPTWYLAGAADGSGGSGGSGGSAGGLMSSSAIPNLGGMMAALGTIGNAPSSSGGSGGGGFGGGSSGGGGGAGGGF
ncbi:MAG TPA: TPM domain-containing protein [Candidatus Limnocylindrales bacterium]